MIRFERTHYQKSNCPIMSATPAKTSILPNDVKTSGGIRKTLLTPCRRIGLSRVVKTPASLEKTGKPTESPLVCKTPVNSQSYSNNNTGSQNKKEACEVKSEKKIEGSLKKPRKVVKKCLLLDEDFKNDVGDSPKRIVESAVSLDEGKKDNTLEVCKSEITVAPVLESGKSRKKIVKVKKCLLPQDADLASGKVSPELFSESPQNSKYLEKKRGDITKSPDFKGFCVKRKNSSSKELHKSNKICDDGAVVERKKEAVLNQEKSTDFSDIEDDFQPISKPKKIRRISSSSNGSIKDKPILKETNTTNSSEKVKASLKKRLSMKKSKCSDASSFKYDSENDFLPTPKNSQENEQESKEEIIVDLTDLPLLYEETETEAQAPSDENDFYEVNEEMLKEIERRIKEKDNKLDRLKRAEVYMKKHKVDELNDLRMKWKSGCCEALRNLLGLLKSQGDNIDMVRLLKTLNVPESMIRCNSENGDLM